jgi:hypothetical protein
MPRGSSSKREHEYQELKTEFKKEGRYTETAESLKVSWFKTSKQQLCGKFV